MRSLSVGFIALSPWFYGRLWTALKPAQRAAAADAAAAPGGGRRCRTLLLDLLVAMLPASIVLAVLLTAFALDIDDFWAALAG